MLLMLFSMVSPFVLVRGVSDSDVLYGSPRRCTRRCLRCDHSGNRIRALRGEILGTSDVEKEVIWDTRNGDEDGTGHKIFRKEGNMGQDREREGRFTRNTDRS